ncbi:formate/nitrite transporter family protein [Azohydromonas australica]|uniref:formate/nitrite transporter family protein n=1 Tax=Azohydromonas australica TaxID=364039 RepID=UPI000413E679|nr:formate/nitrite transporter family protein [Azohydromonas australica]
MDKDQEEADKVEEQTTPRTPVIYETVRRLGEQEMARPAVSLWWSGLAAGLSMSFSLLAQAVLRQHLPEAPWRELVIALGYPVGFLMVVMSRQQLFTETTITVLLPLLQQPDRHKLASALRIWSIVLVANLVGTLLAALFFAFTPAVDDALRLAMLETSRHAMRHDALALGVQGITAGYLMAAMVWLIPAAGVAQFHVVTLMTYLIGVGGFAHIIAGSAEAFLLLLTGELDALDMLVRFTLPVLLGNVIGGTALFALISHAQVMKEV